MLTITDELDAINIMLSAIGSDPVNTLTDTTDVDVMNAKRILEKVSRDVQRKGWDFNRAVYTLYPNKHDKRILWDNTIVYHKSLDNNTYVKRGDYLYDMTHQTYQFEKEIKLEIIKAVDFIDLPDCFKNYIACKAAVNFQARYMGDEVVSQDLQLDVQEAYQDLVQYDLEMSNMNMLHLTNVAEVLVRR